MKSKLMRIPYKKDASIDIVVKLFWFTFHGFYPNFHEYKNFHNQPQNSQHRNITKCYNKSITQRDKLLIQRRRNHMSITEKQRQQQAELHKKLWSIANDLRG
ncbi:TPA: hypothetical protein RWH94_001719, partial [Staphylococcus aureus]